MLMGHLRPLVFVSGRGLGSRLALAPGKTDSLAPRLCDAKMQPLHTFFMQHVRKDDCFASSGKGFEQIGQSSSSDLVRPFFISTS